MRVPCYSRVLSSLWLLAACGVPHSDSLSNTVPEHAAAGAPAAAPQEGGAGAAGNEPAAGSGTVGSPGSAGRGGAPVPSAGSPSAGAGAGGSPRAAGAGAAGAGGSAGADAGSAAPTVEPASCKRIQADADTPVIYVIGDSTASVYEANLSPRMGWAQPLQEYFRPACAKVQDKALSGRSSKSFYDEGAWTPIKSALRAGDYVLIQFGHNDEKREDTARYTEPFGTYQQYLGKYIDDTLAARATPILLTSIERNNWKSGKLSASHGEYPEAVRQLAHMRNLTLVDMTELTHSYFESIGEAATTKLFLNLAPGESPNYPSGNSDNTHLQEKGARIVADLALADLARQRASIAALLDRVPDPRNP
ncbi:MAG TPA: rhamnogalacturonan acetylesterase [Polyangiales bacterium]|nr:rhamnogalacturonan acetylesterase [Polyangiales bacterium]